MTAASPELRLTVLVENTSRRPDLAAEHGFAALLETPDGTLLFDTGARPGTLRANAAALGVDLSTVAAVVLSHGHYDHTGGLAAALQAAPDATVYHGPGGDARRWASRWGFTKSIGLPKHAAEALAQATRVTVERPTEPLAGLLLSGPMAGPPSPAEKGFRAEVEGRREPDAFGDELFLLARTAEGWMLVTGCCHRGLANTLAHARTLTEDEPVRTVLGGLHLKRAGADEWARAAAALDSAGVRHLVAGHCTGRAAVRALAASCAAETESLEVGLQRAWEL